jgi:hypothetical protein
MPEPPEQAEPRASGEETPLKALVETIMAFLNAEDWDESQRIVSERKPLLLDQADAVEAVFAALLHKAGDDAAMIRTLDVHRVLLRRCRELGIRAAFEELRRKLSGETLPSSQDLDILDLIAHNTVAVLTLAPKRREQWIENIWELQGRAREVGDAPMLALLGAVERLLQGEPPDSATPAVSGPHADCWARIVAGLTESGAGAPP